MNELNLVEVMNDEVVTTSKQVAEAFEKEHRHVMRDIKNLIQKDVSKIERMFLEDETTDSYGRPQKQYIMNRDGFSLLTMGFTGSKALEFKLKYIEAFNQMENEIKRNQLRELNNVYNEKILNDDSYDEEIANIDRQFEEYLSLANRQMDMIERLSNRREVLANKKEKRQRLQQQFEDERRNNEVSLRELRKQHDMTQQELAKLLELDNSKQAYISMWENGRLAIPKHVQDKIKECFGISDDKVIVK